MDALRIEQDGPDVRVWVKAVPGASRDAVAGLVAERLKVRVSAPPEAGKANKAVCTLLAKTLGIRRKSVSVEHGRSNPEKIVRITSTTAAEVREGLARACG